MGGQGFVRPVPRRPRVVHDVANQSIKAGIRPPTLSAAEERIPLAITFRMNWLSPADARKNLGQRATDKDRNGVQVAAERFQPKALRLHQGRAATTKRVVNNGEAVGVLAPEYFAGLNDGFLVRQVGTVGNKALDQIEQQHSLVVVFRVIDQ